MAKKQNVVTAEMLREAYIANLEAKRKSNAKEIADFTERELAEFIRQYADANFKGIYVEQDHNYYDRVREKIATNGVYDKAKAVLNVLIGQCSNANGYGYENAAIVSQLTNVINDLSYNYNIYRDLINSDPNYVITGKNQE